MRAGLQNGATVVVAHHGTNDATGASGGAAAMSPDETRLADGHSPAIPITDAEVRKHLEANKDSVRLEAMAAVLRHRNHLTALRETVNAA